MNAPRAEIGSGTTGLAAVPCPRSGEMVPDAEGLTELSRVECIALMKSTPIGRLVFTHKALPAVRPVTFSIVDNRVLIPTRPGSHLAAAARDSVVAFQTDAFDAATKTGWSVTVVGHARVVPDRADARPPLAAPSPRDDFIRIDLDQVSGHCIVTG